MQNMQNMQKGQNMHNMQNMHRVFFLSKYQKSKICDSESSIISRTCLGHLVLFSLWNWGNCTLYRLSVTAASCSHLFMGKLHRLRWKARYSFTQKAVSCKLPNFPTFCPQLSFLPLESQRAASGRWKLSINTNSVKYGPSNTQTGWAQKKYQVLV